MHFESKKVDGISVVLVTSWWTTSEKPMEYSQVYGGDPAGPCHQDGDAEIMNFLDFALP